MADPTLSIAPSEDRRSVNLRFSTDEAGVEMTISAEELNTLIINLAAARATLIPPVPTTHVNAPIQMPVRAQAVVPADRIANKRIILFRHPGFGWLSFELVDDDGADLAAGISAAMHADRTGR